MKTITKSLCAVLSSLMILSAALIPVSAKAKPKLNKTKISLTRTKTYTLKLKNAKTSKITWSTSKKSVASVYLGKVTALKKGTATITAKYKGKKYKCKVTVKPLVTTSSKVFKVYINDTLKLSISKKSGAKYNAKSWKSSNSSIASINSKGVITGKKSGTVTITATKSNGDLLKTKVKVEDPFKALKSYIEKNGKTDQDSNKYIAYSQEGYSYFITYNSLTDEFEFQGDYNGTDTYYAGQFEIIMYMKSKGSKSLPVVSLYLSDDNTKSYKAEAVLDAASFTSSASLDFTVAVSSLEDSNTEKLSNMLLRDLFSGWSKILADNLNMNMSALGFTKY